MPRVICCHCSLPRRLLSLARQRPLAWHYCCAGSCPLPVSVRPCLPSLLPPAIVPCPPSSPHLPSLLRRLLSLACQRLPLPAVVVAATTTDSGGRTGRAQQVVAVRRRPWHPFNLRRQAPPQSLLPPSTLRRRHRRRLFPAFWVKYLLIYRGISYQ